MVEVKAKTCKDGHLVLDTDHGIHIEVASTYSFLLIRLFKKGETKQIGTGFWAIPYNGEPPSIWQNNEPEMCKTCIKESKKK